MGWDRMGYIFILRSDFPIFIATILKQFIDEKSICS